MRFISRYCVKEGMTLDKSIYNGNGDLLLRKGSIINSNYMEKINSIGLSGIYINDELSRDLIMENIVNEEVRNEAKKGVKKVFSVVSDNEDTDESLQNVIKVMGDIIEDILNNDVLLVNMIDIKLFDEYTFEHSVNVAILSLIMGVSLDLNENELYELGIGALLHDIGKVFIPNEILNKKGRLEKEEFNTIKEHSSLGYNLLKNNELISRNSLNAIIDHHERWDGSGYPNNKKKEEISLFGRIVGICDVYDALTSNRVYKNAVLPSEAMECIIGGSGTDFDFELVKVFYRIIATFPLGTIVKLSNGRKAIVIKNHKEFNSRPTVRTLDNNEVLSLINDKSLLNVTIIEVLENN